jgi:hypothetical protein
LTERIALKQNENPRKKRHTRHSDDAVKQYILWLYGRNKQKIYIAHVENSAPAFQTLTNGEDKKRQNQSEYNTFQPKNIEKFFRYSSGVQRNDKKSNDCRYNKQI